MSAFDTFMRTFDAQPPVINPSEPCLDCGTRFYWFNLFGVPICRTCCSPTPGWEDEDSTERWAIQDVERETEADHARRHIGQPLDAWDTNWDTCT